jgi:hypothetical protein
MKTLSLLLICLCSLQAFPQNDSASQLPIDSSLSSEWIDAKSLIGDWKSSDSDSLQHKVRFVLQKNNLTMNGYSTNSSASPSDSLSDSLSIYNTFYDFFFLDSLGRTSNSGVIIQWPPDYCTIYLKDSNTLEVHYQAATGEKLGSQIYHRQKK